jgi:hypothetical protein
MFSITLRAQPDGPTRVIKFIAPATTSTTATSSLLFSPTFLVRRASATAAQRSTGPTVGPPAGQWLSPPPSINSTPERSRARSERGAVLTDGVSCSGSSSVSSGSADTLALRLYCSAIRVSVVDVSASGEMLLGRQVQAPQVCLCITVICDRELHEVLLAIPKLQLIDAYTYYSVYGCFAVKVQ